MRSAYTYEFYNVFTLEKYHAVTFDDSFNRVRIEDYLKRYSLMLSQRKSVPINHINFKLINT